VTAGTIAVDDSIWVDDSGRPNPTRQLIVEMEAPKGGASIGWQLKFQG
jgi:hypothetical protein